MPEKNKNISYRGLIIPSDWDEKGQPTSVCLATDSELIELLPHDKIKNHDLLDLIHKEVEISGQVCRERRKKAIRVDCLETKPGGP